MTDLKYTMIFLKHEDSLLMLNRFKPPLMGLWTGVGGKIERNESPLDGAQREVFEETDLSVGNLEFSGIVTWITDKEKSGMYLFTGNVPQIIHTSPRMMNEGTLEWKDISWVLDNRNQGIPPHVKNFLPSLLQGEHNEYRCYFHKDILVKFEQIQLSQGGIDNEKIGVNGD